jgi:hypothetical protein
MKKVKFLAVWVLILAAILAVVVGTFLILGAAGHDEKTARGKYFGEPQTLGKLILCVTGGLFAIIIGVLVFKMVKRPRWPKPKKQDARKILRSKRHPFFVAGG